MSLGIYAITDVTTLPPLISTPAAAELLSCNPSKVRSMCRTGELEAVKVGTDWRVNTRAMLEQFGLIKQSAPEV